MVSTPSRRQFITGGLALAVAPVILPDAGTAQQAQNHIKRHWVYHTGMVNMPETATQPRRYTLYYIYVEGKYEEYLSSSDRATRLAITYYKPNRPIEAVGANGNRGYNGWGYNYVPRKRFGVWVPCFLGDTPDIRLRIRIANFLPHNDTFVIYRVDGPPRTWLWGKKERVIRAASFDGGLAR